ncbi:hypothetical protein M409DRAFT_55414 [Zasmidium cellare ATCC 36951]|uniref:ISWI chromatin-remodeling complex ATPase ISW2 n=1 Tax=Zasmidium cellare ATCC 36951 TaxID=1080233 RepID=A0A6A6CIP9_ZASCE|nr:uncharacterized protein M409DRAFT_55414 [Zasmidium cellare ATCC 36951]KAF2166070.1 hypothetical protein M409DRAFT_55414 [Zasmidium cellare ATCC 36951]
MDFDDIDDLATSPTPPKRRKVVAVLAPRPSMADLLATWGAVKSPTSATKMRRESGIQNGGIQNGDTGPGLRGTKKPISYAESPPTTPGSNFTQSSYEEGMEKIETPGGGGPETSEDELTGDVIHAVPRGTAAKARESHPQRSRELPTRSTRANISYARPVLVKRTPTKAKKSNKILRSDMGAPAPKAETARTRVRHEIEISTRPKRHAFLYVHGDYFKPLLPGYSYIDKLRKAAAETREPKHVPYKALDKQPPGVKAKMKPYQLEGLSFLTYMHNNGMSSILGDEMGLGKTLQTLALFQHLTETNPSIGENRPFLVVCPLSVLSSWISETRKWTPELNVIRFHGPKLERERFKKHCLERKSRWESGRGTDKDRVDMVVTTYETFVSESSWFKRSFVWRYCVLDEGHKIKNEKSDISSSLQGLSAEYRLLLTGTPLQNNLREMWALLHWLFPDVFPVDTADDFRKAFDLTKGTVSTDFMDDARRLLELIMLRRMKTSPGVNLGLPPKEEVLLFVPLTPMQRFWYTRLLTRADQGTLDDLFGDAKDKEAQTLKHEANDTQLALLEKAQAAAENAADVDTTDVWAESRAIMEEALRQEDEVQEVAQKDNAWKKLMNLMMQLRKVCNHPYLLPNAAPELYDIGEHVKAASGKFIVLDKVIDELVLKRKKKILIFSGFTKTLNLVGELLWLKGANNHNAPFRYARLDGSTNRAQRNLAIRMFNDPKSDYKVMLLSTRAGGLGINLTSATDVVFMDEDWNPQMTLQAEARAHRIGQTQKVTIYKLCTQGTVEEQMMGRIRKKLYLSAKITESMRNVHSTGSPDKKRKRQSTNGGVSDEEAPHLDTASLQSLIRRGAQTLARPEIDVTEMLGWDWETTLEKCKDKPIDTNVNDQDGHAVDEHAWLDSMEKVETAVFEGKKHMKELEKRAKEDVDLNRGDRRLGKNTTVEIDGFMISKESMNCGDWEAVPTFAGKDPRLAEPKREKKAAINHQEFCQVCWAGGDLVCCHGCPRAYHRKCLTAEQKSRSMGMTFYCLQHECRDCGSKTTEAGGLIYRCRWCESGFCEDCLDWENINLVGDSLPEFQMLGFGPIAQAHYIDCHQCVEHWKGDGDAHKAMMKEKKRYDREYEAFVDSLDDETQGGATVTPDTISEVATPVEEMMPQGPVHGHPKPRSAKKAKLSSTFL